MDILEARGLTITETRSGTRLVDGLDFAVEEGGCLAIVGESGCGKSITAKAVLGLNAPPLRCGGTVLFRGKNLLECPERELRRIRGKRIFLIMQDGMGAFDPSCPVGVPLRETLREHRGLRGRDAGGAMAAAMDAVLLQNSRDILRKYPHQLSGGMLQRLMIALALAVEPELVIADEPTTALDAVTRFEVAGQLAALRERTGASMVFISHDLGAVRRLAGRVLVMRGGAKVEEGPVDRVFAAPRHPYTRYLVETGRALGGVFRRAMGDGHA